MLKVAKYVIHDIVRNRILIAYTLLLFCIAMSFFVFGDDNRKAISSLLTVVLIIVPLVSIVFTTVYLFNAYEFIELLVAQPVSRRDIIMGEYTGMAISLMLASIIGIGIPIIIFSFDGIGIILLITGILTSLVFTSLAFLASVISRDKARGIGLSLLLWFYFAIIYDGLVMAVLFMFSDYPLEKIILGIVALNPIDLSRILVLMKMDISTLMGYTGAVFEDFFGTAFGMVFAIAVLIFWFIWPVYLAVRLFKKKNL